MKTIRIRILDDESGKREDFSNKIRSTGISDDYVVALIGHDEIKSTFKELIDRQTSFREKGFWLQNDNILLDDTDILIVDNDLREFFEKTGIFTSADEVAYMARCFSTCKLITIVNRTNPNPFDLTGNFSYFGQFDAFSDIEIGQTQLASKALWGTGNEPFHPWYWFCLPKWLDEFDLRAQDAKTALEEQASILDFFELKDVQEWLPRRVLQSLGEGKKYTFSEFVRSSSFALSPKDRAKLSEGSLSTDTIRNLAPIVAARLWKWLEVQLMPELDILIDAPHLVTRLPSLLDGSHAEVDTWNKVAVRHTQVIPNLKMKLLEDYRFSKMHWLTRPAWYWRKVMNNERIPDVHQPWDIEYVPFTFCEDTSLFLQEELTKTYRVAVDSPFGLRHIEKLDGVEYVPLQRLAF